MKFFTMTLFGVGIVLLIVACGKPRSGDNPERSPKPTAVFNEPSVKAQLEKTFIDVITARLKGDRNAFSSFFSAEGYDLDRREAFRLADKRFKVELGIGLGADTFANIVDAVFVKYKLSEYKFDDVIEKSRIEVLNSPQAIKKFGNRGAGRISRIFRKGGFKANDMFVTAPCRIANYSKGRTSREFNQLFFVGLEHVTDQIFYVFRRSGGKWKIVLFED